VDRWLSTAIPWPSFKGIRLISANRTVEPRSEERHGGEADGQTQRLTHHDQSDNSHSPRKGPVRAARTGFSWRRPFVAGAGIAGLRILGCHGFQSASYPIGTTVELFKTKVHLREVSSA